MDVLRAHIIRKAGFSIAIAAVLAIALLLAAGCGGEAKRATFSYAEPSDPTSIDPALTDESVGVNITRYLFDGLVSYDAATGEVQPAVAESWDVNEDATVFTFHLKKGVKFTNGREVKAGDFIYGWTRALDPSTMSPMAMSILGAVKGASDLADGMTKTLTGVEAPDDYTLKVTLEFPMAEYVTFLGHPVSSPVPEEEVDRTDTEFSEIPVGNGPFRLKEWRKNEYIILEKNPDYYGTKAKLDEVTVKIIPSDTTAIAELKSGNVDAVKVVPPGQTEALRGDSTVRLLEEQVAALGFVGFNLNQDPWRDNVKLRQALNYAIDSETIATKVLARTAVPADGLVPAGVPGRQDGAMPYKYDPARAKSLLAEAGYPGGEGLPALTLAYRTEGPAGDVAQALQSMFKGVGVQVELEGMESGAFLEQMTGGGLSLFTISWGADNTSIDTFLYPLFKSDEAQNVFAYANPEVDALLDRARSTLDTGERTSIYNEAERLILADAPLIPVAFSQDVMAYSPRVTNFVHTPLGDLAINEITVSDK